MKPLKLILLLAVPFLLGNCKKYQKPDVPQCDYAFECKVNGTTWKPKYRWGCNELFAYYTPDTIGNWTGGRLMLGAR